MSSELLSSLLNFAGRGSRKAGLAAGGFTEPSKKELERTKETLENPACLRENGPVIADQD